MMSESEAALTLLSGASVAPNRPLQRRARPHCLQEAADVRNHLRRRPVGQHALEMLTREVVLALEEERPRQLQTHAHETRPVDQDGAERGDGLVEQGGSFRFPAVGLQGGFDGGQTEEEEDVRPIRMVRRERTQDGQRLGETTAFNQRPGGRRPGGRRTGGSGRKRRMPGRGPERRRRGRRATSSSSRSSARKKKGSRAAALLPFRADAIGPRVTAAGARRIRRRSPHRRSRWRRRRCRRPSPGGR